MITRVWHGWTRPENADAYQQLLEREILPGIAKKGIPGYRGAHLLRETLGDEVEFITLLWFDTLDSVRAFTGNDYEAAYVPEETRTVLSRFDTRSRHYDVLLDPDRTS